MPHLLCMLVIFIIVTQMGVSLAIMQAIFSAVDFVHACFYCNYAGHSFFIAV